MALLDLRSTSDPARALAAAEAFLLTQPEQNSLLLTVLAERVAHPADGRWWWAGRGDEVVAFAMQSPRTFRGVLAAGGPAAAAALVDLMAEEAPGLPGIMGEAAGAVAFAGRWAEATGLPVRPVEAQRLYRVRAVRPPAGVVGSVRPATEADRPLLRPWTADFLGDTGSNPFGPDEVLDARLASGRLWLWVVDGEPVSMAAATGVVGGVVRVAFVYTPPEHRRHGYAAACVAALSAQVLADGAGCVLHAQLHNPTSNGVYRRLGYEPVAEVLIYRFG